MRKLKNEKAAGKDEATGEMTKVGGDIVVDWVRRLLRVVLCLKTGDLMGLFHCTRVKERGLNGRIIEALAC